MIERKLFKLLGENKKYIYFTVGLMFIGLIGNIMITASICSFIKIASSNMNSVNFKTFAVYGIIAICGIVLRFLSTRYTGDYKELLGRNVKKELRQKVYNKIICLGVSPTDELRIAGITQTAIEGIEQLDLYYSTYMPQLFYALLAPIFLFLISVFIYWRFAVTLLICVPLIPISIIAVSKYAKKIFNKYWTKYTSMGDSFLDSVQGLRELKIFNTDEKQHMKMNETSEDFRKITMKVLVMQLTSTTIMDLVAYAGAAVGIAIAVYWCAKLGGSPYAALFLILIAVEFFLPLRAFGSAFHIAMNGVSAGNKIIELLELNDPIWGDEAVIGTELAVENVSFSYDGKREVLKDITIHFPSVGLTSIVGESGCGKSTIVNLLIGAYRPTHGSIEIGGKIFKHVSRHSLYAHIPKTIMNILFR